MPRPLRSERARDQRGFTLSEFVLVVVVVVGLIIVAAMSIRGINDEADARECRSEYRALKAASERFKAELSVYPENDQKLQDAGYLQLDDTPNWEVVTETVDGEPTYRPTGGRCA